MLTGMATQTPDILDAGLRSLRWLMTRQTHRRVISAPSAPPASANCANRLARSISSRWRQRRRSRLPDRLARGGDAEWKAIATNVFAWFLGRNDLSIALVDPETGSCRDGLHPDRANENRGGESVVSYLLGLADIRQLARVNVSVTPPVALRAIGA
jgi:hypothetical protein